jgi:type II secretory pathway pseudopilin PulG
MNSGKTDFRRGVRTARQGRRPGFTLIEALAAIMVMVIVIPVLLRGFGIAQLIATHSLQRAEATALAQSKLDEMVATQTWATELPEGDETIGVHSYHYIASAADWDAGEVGIQVLTMTVTWPAPKDEVRKVELTTLVWQPGSTIQTESSTSSGLTGGLLP